VVLGAGFAGLEVTTRLADEFGDEVHVTLIDKGEAFEMIDSRQASLSVDRSRTSLSGRAHGSTRNVIDGSSLRLPRPRQRVSSQDRPVS
jgi:NADH dehydrogenase FAD-containing subunit